MFEIEAELRNFISDMKLRRNVYLMCRIAHSPSRYHMTVKGKINILICVVCSCVGFDGCNKGIHKRLPEKNIIMHNDMMLVFSVLRHWAWAMSSMRPQFVFIADHNLGECCVCNWFRG